VLPNTPHFSPDGGDSMVISIKIPNFMIKVLLLLEQITEQIVDDGLLGCSITYKFIFMKLGRKSCLNVRKAFFEFDMTYKFK
jgi:hypothetical protein